MHFYMHKIYNNDSSLFFKLPAHSGLRGNFYHTSKKEFILIGGVRYWFIWEK